MSAKKYYFTPEIDDRIRKVYLTEVAFKTVAYKGPVKDLALKIGMPRWRISRRARDLGLLPSDRLTGWKIKRRKKLNMPIINIGRIQPKPTATKETKKR